jgi:hypothetical protein
MSNDAYLYLDPLEEGEERAGALEDADEAIYLQDKCQATICDLQEPLPSGSY